MSSRILRIAQWLAIPVGIGLMVMQYVDHRSAVISRLFATASSPSSSPDIAKAAIKKLNTYSGSKPKKLLIQLAVADRDYLDERQDFTIQLLVTQNDPDTNEQMARLLQPFIGLARREVVTKALVGSVCNQACIRTVLHYLEHRWTGQSTREDISEVLAHESPDIKKELNQVDTDLNKVLTENKDSTVAVLHDTYGLGSPMPSSFALHIVDILRPPSACGLIRRSLLSLLDGSKKDQLNQLWQDLKCGE
jgi:hypothetical protein